MAKKEVKVLVAALFIRNYYLELIQGFNQHTDGTSEEFSGLYQFPHQKIPTNPYKVKENASWARLQSLCVRVQHMCRGDAYQCSSRGDGEIISLIDEWKSAAAAKTCTQTGGQLRKQKLNDPYLL